MPAAAVGILVALLVTSAEATVGPSPGAPALRPQPQTAGQAQEKRQAASLTECEQRLQPAQRPAVPVLVVVGASITAGVGAGDQAGSWAVLLATLAPLAPNRTMWMPRSCRKNSMEVASMQYENGGDGAAAVTAV